MRALSPTRRAAMQPAPTPRRLVEQVACRVTPEERSEIEAMARERGYKGGGALLRAMYLAERERARKKAG